MDWAQKKASDLISQFRPFFRADADGMVDGLVNTVAGELRAVAAEAHGDAMKVMERALAEIAAQRRY